MPQFYHSICLCWLFLLAACASHTKPEPMEESAQLMFGRGGGFTGEERAYLLLEDGQLSRVNALSQDTTRIDTLDAVTTHRLFSQLRSLQLHQLDFQHPGNLYYFIREQQADTSWQVVWGHPQHEPPVAVQQLYDSLQTCIPKP